MMSGKSPNLRVGIDTGGTFTDIVCVDAASGAMRVTKVASTPANPAIGLVHGVKSILADASLDDLAGLAHGTTVATNALLQGEITGLGLIVTEGFRHILEIARQAVPEGYGNSYFWVKPERIVPLRHVREVGGRLNFIGEELRPLDEASIREAARFFGSRASRRSASACCTPMPMPRTSAASQKSSPKIIRIASFRCHATCCRNIANTSAPSPRWSTRSSSRI